MNSDTTYASLEEYQNHCEAEHMVAETRQLHLSENPTLTTVYKCTYCLAKPYFAILDAFHNHCLIRHVDGPGSRAAADYKDVTNGQDLAEKQDTYAAENMYPSKSPDLAETSDSSDSTDIKATPKSELQLLEEERDTLVAELELSEEEKLEVDELKHLIDEASSEYLHNNASMEPLNKYKYQLRACEGKGEAQDSQNRFGDQEIAGLIQALLWPECQHTMLCGYSADYRCKYNTIAIFFFYLKRAFQIQILDSLNINQPLLTPLSNHLLLDIRLLIDLANLSLTAILILPIPRLLDLGTIQNRVDIKLLACHLPSLASLLKHWSASHKHETTTAKQASYLWHPLQLLQHPLSFLLLSRFPIHHLCSRTCSPLPPNAQL